jgi:hypothetical protein
MIKMMKNALIKIIGRIPIPILIFNMEKGLV